MVCTVTSTAKSGAYRLTTTYLTDPARPSVVLQTSYTPLTPAAASYRVYVRLDATVGGNGGGGSGNGGADNAVIDTDDWFAGAGLLRHEHRRPTPPIATTPCRASWPCGPTNRSAQ